MKYTTIQIRIVYDIQLGVSVPVQRAWPFLCWNSDLDTSEDKLQLYYKWLEKETYNILCEEKKTLENPIDIYILRIFQGFFSLT